MNKIGIMGSGAFGTGLASALSNADNKIILWGRNSNNAKYINSKNTNQHYLPNIKIPKSIFATSDFQDLNNINVLLMVTPAQHLRETLNSFKIKNLKCPIIVCSKGIESKTGKLQSEIVKDVLGNIDCAAISGPGFAIELAKGMPTALTLAADDLNLGKNYNLCSAQRHSDYTFQTIYEAFNLVDPLKMCMQSRVVLLLGQTLVKVHALRSLLEVLLNYLD